MRRRLQQLDYRVALVVGISMFAVALVGGIIGIWVWAIIGMSHKIGAAYGSTCAIIGSVGLILAAGGWINSP